MSPKCDECKKGQHEHCENPTKCSCRCRDRAVVDVVKKLGAIYYGTQLAIGGLAITILSGGLLIPVGGALMGAGISSASQGIEKSIKRERIDAKGFCIDVGLGALTGLLTGGIGAGGEVIATKVVQQGATEVAKVGAKKLAIRVATGAVAGVVSKVVDEAKEIITTDKKLSDFGRTLDENGKVKVAATAASWSMGIVVGGLGGAGGHASSNATKQVSSGIAKSAVRISVSGATAVVGDTTAQIANIVVDNQKRFDPKRTITTFTASTITATACEGAKNGIYKLNGGKEQILMDKANKKMIREEVPNDERKEVYESYEKLKQIPTKKLQDETRKANLKSKLLNHRENNIAATNQLDAQIEEASRLKQAASKTRDIPSIQHYQQQKENFMEEKQGLVIERKRIEIQIKKNDRQFMNNQNAHVLTEDKIQQLSIDVNPPNANDRGTSRAVFDYNIKDNNSRGEFKFSGYTADHQYTNIPNNGQSDYHRYHTNQDNHLRQVQHTNNLVCYQLIEEEKED